MFAILEGKRYEGFKKTGETGFLGSFPFDPMVRVAVSNPLYTVPAVTAAADKGNGAACTLHACARTHTQGWRVHRSLQSAVLGALCALTLCSLCRPLHTHPATPHRACAARRRR